MAPLCRGFFCPVFSLPLCNGNATIGPSMPPSPPATQATWRFVYSHPAHWLGLGMGSGLAPKAPGTVGTLWGWALFDVAQGVLSHALLGVAVGLGVALGWWACTVSARHLGVADPGCVVWDEMVAIWFILWLLAPPAAEMFTATHWAWQAAAFVLFRYFDAAKPGPVRWADRVCKGSGWRGGWGIMLDDLVAALCTLVALAVARVFLG